MQQTILLIDGSSFIFRAFYAVKHLSSPSGMPTNAIYGIINMLKQMQKKYDTPHWVCVFDAPGKTFRDEIYPEYKANRKATPEELKIQIPYIYEIIADLGIPVIVQEGVEADDVIATIAKRYAALDYKVLIATGDKDFAQIVDDKITLVNTMTNENLDIAGVIGKFGVSPSQIIDYLSLIGDTVDNVPGVTKCGPKTAQKWLQEYGSIANLIIHKDQITGAVGDNLRQAIEWLPTAQQLITIDCNVDIKEIDINDINKLTCSAQNTEKLRTIFKELNFRTWLKEIELNHPNNLESSLSQQSLLDSPDNATNNNDLFDNLVTATTNNNPLEIIANLARAREIINELLNNKYANAAWIINDDYSDINSDIIGVLIEFNQRAYLIKLPAKNDTNDLISEEHPETVEYIALLKSYFEAAIDKIVVNSKHSLYQLAHIGITPQNISGDITIASYIQASYGNHQLAQIINRIFATSIPTEEQIFGKGVKRQKFSSLSNNQKYEYLVNYTNLLQLHSAIISKLTSKEVELYLKTELPLAKLLYSLECAGIKIDIPRLKTLAVKMHAQLKNLEDDIHQKSACVFNINSPKQLQDVLFNNLKLPTTGLKKNTSGYSTDEETLTILAEQGYAIANNLLEYRYLNKLLSTYIDRLPEYADSNGLVHTSLEQTVVTSGRLSSKDPNLQNIPVRSEYGQQIRECFVASDDKHVLICADYSQIELRILAHISKDENLINAFNSGADIHLATASQIFAKPIDEITKDERRYAKSINFGLIYGKSAFGLAKELGIERAAAKLYIDNYFAQYPKVKDYMENIKKFAHEHGYVETIYGRKIYLPNINASNNILRQAEERLALNAPMQGSASDIIKMAMNNIQTWLSTQKLASKMILQIHDELIFNVPHAEVEIILTNLPRLMSETTTLEVSLDIDAKAAQNWGLAH